MWNKIFLLILLSSCLANAWACDEDRRDRRFDPCPAADDFSLPMPGGLRMVFRRVEVPGDSFWGDTRRFVVLGSQGSGVFQLPQKFAIGGSFHDANQGHWYYYLGKYEVSKAQFATLLGQGDLLEGARRLSERTGFAEDTELLNKQGRALHKALAMPVSYLTWLDIQLFLDQYNRWCYEHTECYQAMPAISAHASDKTIPGFFRLPTEQEWEYAARGGLMALDAGTFNNELPFERTQFKDFAWAQPKARAKARPIGTLENTYGFHDLIGNVGEYAINMFQAEIGQGKAGAVVVRGGNLTYQASDLRSAVRSELPLYQLHEGRMRPQRDVYSGFRLVIASPVLATQAFIKKIEDEYTQYLQQVREQSPAQQSLLSEGVQASQSLSETSHTLKEIKIKLAQVLPEQVLPGQVLTESDIRSQPLTEQITDLPEQFAALEARLQETQRQLELSNQATCGYHLKNGLLFISLMADSYNDYLAQKKPYDFYANRANLDVKQQAIKDRAERRMQHYSGLTDRYFLRYLELLQRLYGCGERLLNRSLENFRATLSRINLEPKEILAFELLVQQVAQYGNSTVATNTWQQTIIDEFIRQGLLEAAK